MKEYNENLMRVLIYIGFIVVIVREETVVDDEIIRNKNLTNSLGIPSDREYKYGFDIFIWWSDSSRQCGENGDDVMVSREKREVERETGNWILNEKVKTKR